MRPFRNIEVCLFAALLGACFLQAYRHCAASFTPIGSPQMKLPPNPQANGQAQYEVIDLGTLDASDPKSFSHATAINASGEIIGESIEGTGKSHAFYWKQGKMIELKAADNMICSEEAINNSSLIVGNVVEDLPNGPTIKAAQWKDGKYSLLPFATNGTLASGVNNKGIIAGTLTAPDKKDHACVWQEGKIIDLGTLGGRESSGAKKINDKGQVVGISTVEGGGYHACLWTPDGKIIDLTPNSDHACAYAVNDNGAIVGDFDVKSDAPNPHAFLYQEGKLLDLGQLPHFDWHEAFGINNARQVVGRATNSKTNTECAFLWDKGKIIDLNSRIDPKSGWNLEIAKDINDRGEIVGFGVVKGKHHAFLLKPISKNTSSL